MEQKNDDAQRIIIDPKVMLGKPIIRGTRIPVYVVLNLLSEGCTVDEVTMQYPDVAREDVFAALKFAAQFTKFEEVAV